MLKKRRKIGANSFSDYLRGSIHQNRQKEIWINRTHYSGGI